jgi:hypothetical protein
MATDHTGGARPSSASSQHETLAVDLLAVRGAVQWLAESDDPERTRRYCRTILGEELNQRLEQLEPTDWVPIEWLISMMNTVEAKLGPSGLRRMGRTIFLRSHSENARNHCKSARDILHAMDTLYRLCNRGVGIGGWTVLSFEPTEAVLENTTPHHCLMEEGIVVEACATFGCHVVVTQRKCVRNGDDSCVFVVTPTAPNPLWMR